jgi:hypothetical protein
MNPEYYSIDEELDKYEEAARFKGANFPDTPSMVDGTSFNASKNVEEVFTKMPNGGHVKIAEREITPEAKIMRYNAALREQGITPTADDFYAAGFDDQQIAAAGLLNIESTDGGRTEPLSEYEKMFIERQGGELYNPPELTFGQKAADLAASTGRVVGGGIQDTITGLVGTADDIGEAIGNLGYFYMGPDGLEYSREKKEGHLRADKAFEKGLDNLGIKIPEGDGPIESLARGLMMFASGMTIAPVKGVNFLSMMLRGGFADALLDPEEGNISTLAREFGIDNAILEFLDSQVDEEASALERLGARLTNTFEGVLAGGVIDGLIKTLGFGLKKVKGDKSLVEYLRGKFGVVKDRLTQTGDMPTVGMFGGNYQNIFLKPGQKRSFYVTSRSGNENHDAAVNRVQEISKSKGNKRVKIEDLVDFFEENHLQIYGRKLNPDIDEDFNIAADAAADEILYQMDQAVNGIGWYDKDVKRTFALMAKTPGLEELGNNETLRVIWSAIAAPTSIGNKVNNNTRAATAAFLQYLKTGKVPVNPPLKGATTEGISGAGWGLKQQSVAAGMKVISYLIDTKGPEGFADWWLSPHTLGELTAVRKAAGLSSGPVGVGGGKDSVHLGAMVLGDKTGPYSLNINGYQGTTKDIWFSRSYNRHFGNMRNADGSIAGQPRNQVERRRMEQFTRKVIDNLQGLGLSEQDAQAVLWFYEQGLFTDLGVVSRPGSFSEAMEKISNDLRSGVRASDENKIGTESPTAEVTGFRSISNPKRTVRSTRRDQQIDDQQSGPYSRGSGAGSEGTGLLVLTPNENIQAIYNKADIALPKITETKASETANQYNLDMTSAMSNHKYAAQVEIKSPEDLADARLFRTENGSGFAIKSDGDIVAVFQSANESQSVGYAMIQAAVEAGGRKLDAFETFLPGIYETAGFKPVARLGWSDEFAPPNWNKETFKSFNNGEPDVVFYVYDPNYFGGATDVPRINTYDEGVVAQEQEISKLKETIDGY